MMWPLALALIGIAVLVAVLAPSHINLAGTGTVSEARYVLHRGSEVVYPGWHCLEGGQCRLVVLAKLFSCGGFVDSWGRPIAVANVSIEVLVRPGPGYPWRPIIAPAIRVEGGSIIREVHAFDLNGSYLGSYYLVSSGSTLIYAASLPGETHIVELVVNC